MLDRTLQQTELPELVERLGAGRRLIGPVARGDGYCYEEIKQVGELAFPFSHSSYSPRNFLFPPTETLFTFDRNKGGFVIREVIDHRPKAFVGVHPCDIHAIRLLDRVFEKDHRDEHYLARRRNTFIVGMDCKTPCTDGVFCGDMHTNAAAEGFDVMLYPLGASDQRNCRYGVVFGTDEGRDWVLSSNRSTLPAADDMRAFDRYQADKIAAFPQQLRTRYEDLPALLTRSYDSLLWEATAQRCYSCGSCNLVCPTCYCFNITDEMDMDRQRGERRREWDSCMLRDFASVAGGHNFRSKAAQRLRHRVFRKSVWIQEHTGMAGCVGCGRCDRACTARISILNMLNQLAEEK